MLIGCLCIFMGFAVGAVFPNIPLNFTAKVSVLGVPSLPMQVTVQSGYYRFDPSFCPFLAKMSPFAFAPGTDYYLAGSLQGVTAAYLVEQSSGHCQQLGATQGDLLPLFGLVSFSWLAQAAYIGESEPGSPFGANCAIFQSPQVGSLPSGANSSVPYGIVGSVCKDTGSGRSGKFQMVTPRVGLVAGYQFTYSNVKDVGAVSIKLPSSCNNGKLQILIKNLFPQSAQIGRLE